MPSIQSVKANVDALLAEWHEYRNQLIRALDRIIADARKYDHKEPPKKP